MRRIIGLSVLLLSAWSVQAEVQGQEVTYQAGDTTLKGYLAYDDAITGQRPGILVVHEWWGQNEYPRQRAKMLAELGYTALALDMYGDGQTAGHPDDAGAFMNAVLENMEAGRARFEAAHEALKQHPTVDAGKTGAIGYCFGGGVVLHMARMGSDLKAVASFHGSLPLAIAPGPEHMNTRVVAYNGEADGFIPGEAIEAFKAEMQKVGAHYDFIQLPGALHGFSNPAATENGKKFGLPLAYSPLADQASWAHMQLVFEQAFGE
jgi:dienelactone hydrolase